MCLYGRDPPGEVLPDPNLRGGGRLIGFHKSPAPHHKAVSALQAALPDGRTTLDDVVAEGDKVVSRWTFRGTHKGPLMGIPATAKQITIAGITIDRIADGRIVERWSQVDALGMMQQLGAIPSPEQAR